MLDAARRWQHQARLAVFDDRTPVDMLLARKLQCVTGLRWKMNNGMMS